MAQKSTKRLLIASIVSVVLCLTMLVGTTFAWFTDEVTSGLNTIVAGQLDVELEYKREGMAAYSTVTDKVALFDENAKWEPGYVEYVDLRINNKGTLAFNYDLGLNVGKVVGDLDEHLEYAIVDVIEKKTDRATVLNAVKADAKTIKEATGVEGTIKAGEEPVEKTLVVYMPTTVGNEVNTGNASIELGVKLFASQAMVEGDSFGNTYDMNATAAQDFRAAGTYTVNGKYKGKPGDMVVKAIGEGVIVNITGGEYDGGEGGNNVCVAVANGATANIYDGKFTVGKDANGGGNSVIYSQGGTINIYGGEFYTDTPANYGKEWYYVLNQQNGNPGTITVYGGSFRDYNPANGDDNLGGNFVAKGYRVIKEDRGDGHTWYTVVGNAQEFTGNGTYEVHGTFIGENADDMVIKAIGEGVTVNITGGYYDGGKGGNNVCVAVANGATANIHDGEFTVGADAKGGTNSVIYSQGGNINIYGGKFYASYETTGWYYVLNQNNGAPGTIKVYGGSFRDYNPANGDDNLKGNFVAEGYEVVEDTLSEPGHTWYHVVPKA